MQTEELQTNTYYLDNELFNGVYEYYVITFYENECISDSSNHVKETIDVEDSCKPVNDLTSEKLNENTVRLIWSEPESDLTIKGYNVFRNEMLQNDELLINLFFTDENLPYGVYEYYVVTSYSNGCISDSSNHVKESVELEIIEVKRLEEVILYPNPTDGQLRIINYELRIEGIEIFDIYGRKILEPPLTGLRAYDLTVLHPGIYFVKITTEKGTVTQKIIKY